jgi:hypothetical protein
MTLTIDNPISEMVLRPGKVNDVLDMAAHALATDGAEIPKEFFLQYEKYIP